MNLLSRNSRQNRQQSGNADPAHAFGSEEQLMAEFQRQEYIQPQPKNSVLNGIRSRLANLSVRPHQTDAPVYSAETYSDENAPDLGWEAAFDPQAAQYGSGTETFENPTAQERFEQFRNTVYSSPVRSGSTYSFGSYTRPAPLYEEISLSGTPVRESTLQKPVYEEISFGKQAVREPASIPSPVYEELTPVTRPSAPPSSSPVVSPDLSLNQDLPAADRSPAVSARGPHASDLQYVFWSGTILAGVVLTVFSFIYACAM